MTHVPMPVAATVRQDQRGNSAAGAAGLSKVRSDAMSQPGPGPSGETTSGDLEATSVDVLWLSRAQDQLSGNGAQAATLRPAVTTRADADSVAEAVARRRPMSSTSTIAGMIASVTCTAAVSAAVGKSVIGRPPRGSLRARGVRGR